MLLYKESTVLKEINKTHKNGEKILGRASPGHMGAMGRLIIWCPFKLMYFKIFCSWTGLFLRVCTQTADIFQRNSCAETSLLAPYF
jgi:hypothetical protein